MLHFNLHRKFWQLLGHALAQNKTLLHLSLRATNIADGDNLLILLQGTSRAKCDDLTIKGNLKEYDIGLVENQVLETLDLSDNELTNAHGIMLLKFIENQGTRRDKDLWQLSLRHRKAEKKLKEIENYLGVMSPEVKQEIDSVG